MGVFAACIAMELHTITAAGSGTSFRSLLQQCTDTQAASRRVDTKITDAAEISGKCQLHDEMQGDEPEHLTAIALGHQQAGIAVTH